MTANTLTILFDVFSSDPRILGSSWVVFSQVFDRIREENRKALNKVIPIQGDITFDGLGIPENELNLLIQDVSIVFHSAATVKFDEPLK